MSVRLKDVASKAGVSVATVSHVVNNTKPVSEKTKARIEAAIKELSYTPNFLAKSLKENRSKVIGLIIPDISNYYFTEIASIIEQRLNDAGYNMILCNSNENLELEIQHIQQLKAYMVSGMIIAPTTMDFDYRKLVASQDYPIVFIDRKLSTLQGDSIIADGACAVEEAVSYLIKKGHKRIGFIGANRGLSTTANRFLGYQNALKKNGIPLDSSLCVFGEPKINPAMSLCNQLFSQTNISALLVSSSLMSIGAVQFFTKNNIKIPEQIALIGYDDYIWSTITAPPLSTIKQPTSEIGYKAAETMLNRLEKGNTPITEILLNSEFIIRESC